MGAVVGRYFKPGTDVTVTITGIGPSNCPAEKQHPNAVVLDCANEEVKEAPRPARRFFNSKRSRPNSPRRMNGDRSPRVVGSSNGSWRRNTGNNDNVVVA